MDMNIKNIPVDRSHAKDTSKEDDLEISNSQTATAINKVNQFGST